MFRARKSTSSSRGKHDQRESTSWHNTSGVPITKILVKKTTAQSKTLSHTNNDEAVHVDDGQADLSPYPSNIDLLQTLVAPKNRNGWMISPRQIQLDNKVKPSLTLETFPDGDKINFSCTIDKKILRHPTSVAFHLTQAKLKQGQHQDKFTPEIDMDQTHEVNDASENCILSGNLQSQCFPSYLPILGRSEYYSSMLTGTSSSSSSRLSLENMLQYEKENTLDEAHRIKLIEAWITDVNEARRLKRLLQGRERLDDVQQTARYISVSPQGKHDAIKDHTNVYNPKSNSDQRPVLNTFSNDVKYKRKSADIHSDSTKPHLTRKENYSGKSKENDRLHYCNIKGEFHDYLRRKTVLPMRNVSREKTNSLLYRHRMYVKNIDT
jgi:hypothetical protein